MNAPAGVPLATLAKAAAPATDHGPRTTDSAPLYTIIRPDARDRWLGAVARSFDPARVEAVLRSALNGNLVAQWELFDLMEDTAPRIKKNLNRLKRAVKARRRNFEPWTEDDEPATPEAEQRSKVASSALWKMRPRLDENQNGFDDTIYDILDAWAKGIAVLEVNWEVRDAGKLGMIVAPQSTRYLHPRYYGFSSQGDWLGLNVAEVNATYVTAGSPAVKFNLQPVDGIYARFPENKFLLCICKSKSGHPAGGALLRALAFWWAAANFTQEWFLNLAQIFGLPIRWANYDPNTPGLVAQILDMLENMGSAGYAAFPAGTTLELKEGPKAGTDNPQVALLDRFERACDYLILGQSGTTDIAGPGKTGGSNAANEVLQDVEGEIIESACDFVESVFNDQLLPMINRLNWHDEQLCPELCLELEVVEDVEGLIGNYKTGVEAQVITPNAADEKHLRQKLNLPAMPPEVEADWAENGVRSKAPATPFGGVAMARAGAQNSATDSLVNHTLEKLTGVEARWLGGLKPTFHKLIALAQSEKVSDADFVAALAKAQREWPELFHQLDAGALEESLYEAMSSAVVNGAVRGHLQRRGRTEQTAVAHAAASSFILHPSSLDSLFAHAAAAEITLADGALPRDVQWMPPGRQVVQPLGFDEPFEMVVTPAIAQTADRQLQELRQAAATGRDAMPYGDFNHKDEGRSFLPVRFFWGGEDPKSGGVRLELQWTGAGAKAVLDGEQSVISPSWVLSKTTKEFLGIKHNVGGLVPRSAFHSIQAFAKADSSKANPQPPKTMTREEMMQALTDVLKPFGDRLTTLEANAKPATQAATGITAADITAALNPLREEIKSLREGSAAQVLASAKATVETVGIRGGRIAAQDKDAIDYWTKAIAADAKAADVLAKITPNPAFVQIVQAQAAGGSGTATTGQLGRDKETSDKIMAKARVHQAAGLKFDAAWAKATEEVMTARA